MNMIPIWIGSGSVYEPVLVSFCRYRPVPRYDGSPLDRLRNDETQMIAEFYPLLAPHLSRLRAFPNWFLVDMTASDLDAMDEVMRLYHLRPRDALHLAAIQKCGCLSLVSNDARVVEIAKGGIM